MGEKTSGLTGETRASVTPEKRIQKKKKGKSLSMSPPRKDSIRNQNKNIYQKDQCLPSDVPPFSYGNE